MGHICRNTNLAISQVFKFPAEIRDDARTGQFFWHPQRYKEKEEKEREKRPTKCRVTGHKSRCRLSAKFSLSPSLFHTTLGARSPLAAKTIEPLQA